MGEVRGQYRGRGGGDTQVLNGYPLLDDFLEQKG